MTVTGVTSSTITVQWGSVPCIHQNGNITGYSVQYGEVESGDIQTLNVSGAGSSEVALSGLTPGTSYMISVAAINIRGTGVSTNASVATLTGIT